MLELNEEKDVVVIARSQFRLSYLRSVTMEEAIEHYKGSCHDDRVRNAWKRANKKK